MTHEVRRIVGASWLLTQDKQGSILRDAGVAIAGETIAAVAPLTELRQRYPAAELLYEPQGLVMPGLINTHTHAAMSCLRGLADDLPLMRWLTEYIFPVERKLTAALVYDATMLSICEMIRSGTTSFCDMYLFAKEVARAADQAGMRAWVGEVLYDFPSPNYGELENGFRYTEELFDAWGGHPLVTVTADPHAIYTCAPELLKRLGRIADARQALYVIHLAETRDEVQGCRERHGTTPVRYLDGLGLLGERTLAVHCVVLEPEEIELLARRGVKVAHCMESNLKLASGEAPVPELLDAGVTVGLGTDGSASNNDVDMFGEMGSVGKIHKVVRLDPTVMPAQTVLHAATMGGAVALGAGDRIGSLEAGKKADFIVLDLDQPHLTPMYHPVSHLVYAARGGDVKHSFINGRQVMHDRRLLTLDEADILARMRAMADEIQARMNR
ncbi:MAG: S-adenosylhomocysteine deaminase [Desulfobulbaceae bacterium A2]|nr:MAG: S-adenosylhomocysteine deaminase [Desulfobulbaceae bacterium A2]